MDWQSLWQSLRRAVDAERHMGYTDGGVVGGFAAYMISLLNGLRISLAQHPGPWGPRIALWESRLQDYQRMSLHERRVIVEQISQNLGIMEREPVTLSSEVLDDKPSEARATAAITGNSVKRKTKGPGTSIQFLRGVGPHRAIQLKRLGIETVSDLLFHLPFRYIDRSQITKIAGVKGPGEITVMGVIRAYQEWRPRRGLTVFKGQLDDGTGILPLVWFNRKHLPAKYPPGCEVVVSGKIEFRYGSPELHVAEIETQDEAGLHTHRIVPVYPSTEGLNQRFLRSLYDQVVNNYRNSLVDFVPGDIISQLGMPSLSQAIQWVHFPENLSVAEKGRRRLAFDEVFLLQAAWQFLRSKREKPRTGFRHAKAIDVLREFRDSLPFTLTSAQERVIVEIEADMESDRPMNRLLQGDVGAGKTIIAATAVVKAVASGFQAAVMAPTEILAEQHAIGWQRLLAPMAIPVGHLSGSLGKRRRDEMIHGLADGSIPVVAGTHALLQKDVIFKRLGLVIIDEQHRFGVRQRAALWGKGEQPDLLVMTATPIPRTLAMTLYGDLDVSVLAQRPPGRQEIKTYHVGSKALHRVYNLIRREVALGNQAYVVCPTIEESEGLDLAAVENRYKILSRDVFPDLKVGILHGRMKKDEKSDIMEAFYRGQLDVLVATTVIEVGIDVPKATVMVIEDAERFGLAQLHQLRGRVGRGVAQSYCILVTDRLSEEGRQRMKAMEATNDGFHLAEEDLKLRGPGEMLGTRQSGLAGFKVADLTKDADLIEKAKITAISWLKKDQDLNHPASSQLAKKIRDTFHGLDLPEFGILRPRR